jgi:hypothetical protein
MGAGAFSARTSDRWVEAWSSPPGGPSVYRQTSTRVDQYKRRFGGLIILGCLPILCELSESSGAMSGRHFAGLHMPGVRGYVVRYTRKSNVRRSSQC